jgi:hypothetical protein
MPCKAKKMLPYIIMKNLSQRDREALKKGKLKVTLHNPLPFERYCQVCATENIPKQ